MVLSVYRSRPRPRAIAHARTFYTTALVVTALVCYGVARNFIPAVQERNARHVTRALLQQDLECRLVHGVDPEKQCEFIRANCPDEEAGLASYLQLYYCDLPNAKPVGFFIIVLWCSLLFSTIGIAASDFLCINLSTIAALLGMSESLTGVTFLAFGNGSPDVFSTFAAMSTNSGSLAVGELIGAASFITAVVSGAMALTKPFKVAKKAFVRDVLFFAVAASFSLVFMADGSLKLWECIVMIAFYVFYVCFVVAWHWYLTRSRRIKLAETAARMHLHIPDQQELEAPAIEIDEEARPTGERSPLLRGQSSDSVYTLHGESPVWRDQDEEDDETRHRYLAELQSNMRLDRSRGARRNTLTPIRPSLVGALEFRSVLSSLEKKGTSQSISMTRYSDDPNYQLGHAAQPYSTTSQPDLIDLDPPIEAPRKVSASGSGRNRAVSANDAAHLKINTDLLTPILSGEEAVISASPLPSPEPQPMHARPSASYFHPLQLPGHALDSPTLIVSDAGAEEDQSLHTPRTRTLLAPPINTFHSPRYEDGRREHNRSPLMSPMSPGGVSPRDAGSSLRVPLLHSPHPENYHDHPKSPLTSEMLIADERSRSPSRSRSMSTLSSRSASVRSIRLPAPSISPESTHDLIIIEDGAEEERQPLKWWPYSILPAPEVLAATLFPTLYGWRKKNWSDKLLGIITTPSVFLLTITLPVVDQDGNEGGAHAEATTGAHTPAIEPRRPSLNVMQAQDPPKSGPATPHPHNQRRTTSGVVPTTTLVDETDAEPKEWGRWLVFVQVFTAPFFFVTIVWANVDDGHSLMLYTKLVLGSLVFSLGALLILLFTTRPDHEPKFRPLLCFMGFLVAIAWISTIANEVVGVLKTIGVILNMSDAILGLTIFAVGNSLGDLVADITVAKLGYPVMALSACFGGPMLNILLGIGISGTYLTLRSPAHKHHKHSKDRYQYQPYALEVSTTLMISGITLLVTLLGLLIVVPLNGWKMDRKVGIGLIVVWSLSTIGNVIVEVLGYGGDLE